MYLELEKMSQEELKEYHKCVEEKYFELESDIPDEESEEYEEWEEECEELENLLCEIEEYLEEN